MTELSAPFDYAALDDTTRNALQDAATRFHRLAQDAAVGLWQMGEILSDAQGRLSSYGNGTFRCWLETEAGVSVGTAYRLINIFRAFDCTKLEQSTFGTTALYLLSAPSTPPEARAEALYRADRGEEITHAKAQEIVDSYTPRPVVATPEPEPDRHHAATGTPPTAPSSARSCCPTYATPG